MCFFFVPEYCFFLLKDVGFLFFPDNCLFFFLFIWYRNIGSCDDDCLNFHLAGDPRQDPNQEIITAGDAREGEIKVSNAST
jgi:hypothetical protein